MASAIKLPSYEECIAYFDRYHVPINFLLHCKKVAQAGRFLAHELKKKNININVDLTERACLLHNLFKFVMLDELKEQPQFEAPKPTPDEINSWRKLKEKYKGKHEVEILYDILHDTYPELALLIKNASDHKRAGHEKNRSWEERIQHYADWRVLGDKIVSFDERAADGLKRYGKAIFLFGGQFEKEKKAVLNDEKEIFSLIGCSHDILLKFNEDVHKVNADAYNEFIESHYERVKDIRDHYLFLKDLPLKKGDKALEAGCGFGRDAAELQKHGIKVTGVDISPKMIGKAKSLFKDIPFFVMDLRKLDFKNEAFDHAICNAVLLHFPKEEIPAALQELKRVLKKKGKLWIGVKKGSGEGFEMRKESLRYLSFFSKEEIQKLVEKAGFTVDKIYENKETRKDGEEIEWINIIAEKN